MASVFCCENILFGAAIRNIIQFQAKQSWTFYSKMAVVVFLIDDKTVSFFTSWQKYFIWLPSANNAGFWSQQKRFVFIVLKTETYFIDLTSGDKNSVWYTVNMVIFVIFLFLISWSTWHLKSLNCSPVQYYISIWLIIAKLLPPTVDVISTFFYRLFPYRWNTW